MRGGCNPRINYIRLCQKVFLAVGPQTVDLFIKLLVNQVAKILNFLNTNKQIKQ